MRAQLRARLRDLERRERERAELLEIARFRAAELERAELVAGEDDELAANRAVLANATRLAAAASEAEQSLYGGESAAIDAIARAERASRRGRRDRSQARCSALELIASARANLEEAARGLGRLCRRASKPIPNASKRSRTALQELTRLKRKYGGTIESALEALERIAARNRRARKRRREPRRHRSRTGSRTRRPDRRARAVSISKREHDAAGLKRRMEAELKTLGMRSAIFEPRLTADCEPTAPPSCTMASRWARPASMRSSSISRPISGSRRCRSPKSPRAASSRA